MRATINKGVQFRITPSSGTTRRHNNNVVLNGFVNVNIHAILVNRTAMSNRIVNVTRIP